MDDNRDDRRGGFLRLERGRQAFRCEHRQRGVLGDALQDRGQISSSPSGGDRRSGRVDAQLDYLLGLIRRTPEIPLLEIQERLIQN